MLTLIKDFWQLWVICFLTGVAGGVVVALVQAAR